MKIDPAVQPTNGIHLKSRWLTWIKFHMKQNTSFVKILTVKRIARVAGGISVGVLFWRRSREKCGHKSIWFSLASSPLASGGGSAAKKVLLAQEFPQLGRLFKERKVVSLLLASLSRWRSMNTYFLLIYMTFPLSSCSRLFKICYTMSHNGTLWLIMALGYRWNAMCYKRQN